MISVSTSPLSGNNDNNWSWISLLKDNPEFQRLAVAQIPLANWFIQKHCKLPWKNHPESGEYQSAQQGIAMTLAYPECKLEYTLEIIAINLRCSPIPLYNDQSLEVRTIPTLYFPPPSEDQSQE